jgi:hypothetical protein
LVPPATEDRSGTRTFATTLAGSDDESGVGVVGDESTGDADAGGHGRVEDGELGEERAVGTGVDPDGGGGAGARSDEEVGNAVAGDVAGFPVGADGEPVRRSAGKAKKSPRAPGTGVGSWRRDGK